MDYINTYLIPQNLEGGWEGVHTCREREKAKQNKRDRDYIDIDLISQTHEGGWEGVHTCREREREQS